MKKITLLFCLVLLMQNAFAQITTGTYYTSYGLLARIVQVDIQETTDKKLTFSFENIAYTLYPTSANEYQDEENTCQLKLRDDKDIELYTINKEYGWVSGAYLLTKNKEEAKERWKKAKSELNSKITKKLESKEDTRLAYFYSKENPKKFIKTDSEYKGQDEIKIIINFDEKRYNDYNLKKVEENVYLYSDDRRGGVSIVFARFFPAENKMVVIRQPFGNNPDTYIAQKGAFNLSEADNQKLKDFQAYTLNYLVKHRVAYFANFKSNTSADLPQAKITEAIKAYFEEEYTLSKVKLITSAWTLERNEFGRTMRRLHTVLAYLKEKKTGKCAIAFRHIGQEFDGSSYGDVVFYKRSETYYDLVDDKKNTLQVFLLNAEYEIPCNEVPK